MLAGKANLFLCVATAFSWWKHGERSYYRIEWKTRYRKEPKRLVFNERAKHWKVYDVKRTEVCFISSCDRGEFGPLWDISQVVLVIHFYRLSGLLTAWCLGSLLGLGSPSFSSCADTPAQRSCALWLEGAPRHLRQNALLHEPEHSWGINLYSFAVWEAHIHAGIHLKKKNFCSWLTSPFFVEPNPFIKYIAEVANDLSEF